MELRRHQTVILWTAFVAGCGDRTGLDVSSGAGRVDAGQEAGTDEEAGPPVGLQPLDPACTTGGSLATVYPPYVPLVPPDLPAGCASGFELGDAVAGSVYFLFSTILGGAAAITLDVDFATYRQPDGVQITGVTASGDAYTLLDTCRLQTWDQGDPTGGRSRPPDETIRQFRLPVLGGTTSLAIDFSGVVSPMYLQVLGLCQFNVTPFPDALWWQPVP